MKNSTKQQNHHSFYISPHHLVPGTDEVIQPVSHVLHHAEGLKSLKYAENKSKWIRITCFTHWYNFHNLNNIHT